MTKTLGNRSYENGSKAVNTSRSSRSSAIVSASYPAIGLREIRTESRVAFVRSAGRGNAHRKMIRAIDHGDTAAVSE